MTAKAWSGEWEDALHAKSATIAGIGAAHGPSVPDPYNQAVYSSGEIGHGSATTLD
jgi:hypothetical protein